MKRIFIITVISLFLILIGSGSYFYFGSFSEGIRAGRLMKMSHKGWVFKTWEGQLDVGGLQDSDGDGAATTTWSFSVREQSVVDSVNKAMEYGYRVRLNYEQKHFTLPWWGETEYFITKVEKVK